MEKYYKNKFFKIGKLQVKIFEDRKSLGKEAAVLVAKKMKELFKEKEIISMVFAAAPSQEEFLIELGKISEIVWERVVAFHLDEYVGVLHSSKQSLGNFLNERLFQKVLPQKVYFLNGMADDIEAECNRYAILIKKYPFDIACIGIGENGHLAFNDPPFADFNDVNLVKVVELDQISRQQQVNDGCFQNIDDVPRKAITLTIPAIFSARFIYCIVPGKSKAEAVKKTLEGPITSLCPASILREHDNAILFLDKNSARLIQL